MIIALLRYHFIIICKLPYIFGKDSGVVSHYLFHALEFRDFLVRMVATQGYRAESTLLFNPYLWENRWIHTFLKVTCAKVYAGGMAGIWTWFINFTLHTDIRYATYTSSYNAHTYINPSWLYETMNCHEYDTICCIT